MSANPFPVVRVALVAARDFSSAATLALPSLESTVGDRLSWRVVTTGRPDAAARSTSADDVDVECETVHVLSKLAGPTTVVRPSSSLGAWRADYGTVDLSRVDPDLATGRVDRRVFTSPSTSIVVMNRVEDGVFALALWRAFAHPRDRLLAIARGEPVNWTAALAASFSPAMILLSRRVEHRWIVAATADQIAADLIGLSLAREQVDDPEAVGPWEHPLVQRATELEIGVRLPRQLRLEWTAIDLSRDEIGATQLSADRIAASLGVEASTWTETARSNS